MKKPVEYITHADVAALGNAVVEFSGWRGNFTGFPDALAEFDERLVASQAALTKVRKQVRREYADRAKSKAFFLKAAEGVPFTRQVKPK